MFAEGMSNALPWWANAQVCAVKSENDKLSDTQRLWVHVLSSAGVKVELCHAVAKKAVDVKGEKEMSE